MKAADHVAEQHVGGDIVLAHADAASDCELLAAVVGMTAARRLLRRFHSLHGVLVAGDADILSVGVSPSAVRLLRAARELGARASAPAVFGELFSSPEAVAGYFGARIGHRPVEEFWLLGLNVRHRLVREFFVARGSLSGVEVHPREVFRPLIKAGVAAAIAGHNHPSGDPTPSRQDIELTARLREVGDLCGIPLLDHLVVTSGGRWMRVS
jgi:DNA repair protein RadC